MAESIMTQQALAQRMPASIAYGADGSVLRIVPRPSLCYLHLRTHPDDADARIACQTALSGPLPLLPNTLAHLRDGMVAWLGPGEWLLESTPAHGAQMAAALRLAAVNRLIACVDLSHGRVGLEIGGKRAIDLLRKGCTLDLRPRRFASGQCARTALAKANVLLWPVAGVRSRYRLVVDRSYAHYLWTWLVDAAREFDAADSTAPQDGAHHARSANCNLSTRSMP